MSRFARAAGMALSAFAMAAANGRASREDEPGEPQPLDTLRDFEAVTLAGPDELFVREGDDWSVAVEGDPEAIALLEIYVRDQMLHVGRRRQLNWLQSDEGASVRVTMPVLRRVSLAGSGDLRAEGMSGDSLDATLAGSGDLILTGINARAIRISVAGSGMVTASGTVQESRVSIAGSGDVCAERLVAERAKVSVAGSGDATVHASESAKVSLVGSGSVSVHGTDDCRISKIGSGDVHCCP